MKLKFYHVIPVMLVAIFFSCKKDNPATTGTLTVKTDQGVTVNTKYSSATTQIANTFQVTFGQGATDQSISFNIYVDQSNYGAIFVGAPALAVGTYDSTTYPGQVEFAYETTNWIPPVTYYMSVTFTNYNPHGRISGSALRKDASGNIVETANFDFVAK